MSGSPAIDTPHETLLGGSAAEDTTQHRTTHMHTHTLLRGWHRRRVGAVAGDELRGQLLPERDQHPTKLLPLQTHHTRNATGRQRSGRHHTTTT